MASPNPFNQLIPLEPSDSPIPLPTPPGPHKVGTVSLETVDASRRDPYAPTPQSRRLMLSFFYPTSDDTRPFAPYHFSPKTAAQYDAFDHLPYGTFARYQPQAYDRARVGVGPLPIILFSPGFGVGREYYTITLENLASEGYFCVAIGHTYDTAIDFPDGETVWQIGWADTDFELVSSVRVQDSLFVLEQLAKGAFVGRIAGLEAGTLNLDRVGMFGHSIGGAATLEAMDLDSRVLGGANLDGRFEGDFTTDRPFLVLNGSSIGDPESGADDKEHLKGWRAELEIEGAVHMSFLDDAARFKVLGVLEAEDPKKIRFGTVDPLRMMVIVSKYLGAFFDFVLKGGSDQAFRVADPAFLEVKLVQGAKA
ncbi:MAG: hypothetical protein M1839_004633 [Geoglossum umbratile]|nr:MAG: hypothetical protein M1839_004633 [Geoglossum umbratile]